MLIRGRVVPNLDDSNHLFVDLTGQYVQDCHIPEHEDRGMMQLLEVVNNRTIPKHH